MVDLLEISNRLRESYQLTLNFYEYPRQFCMHTHVYSFYLSSWVHVIFIHFIFLQTDPRRCGPICCQTLPKTGKETVPRRPSIRGTIFGQGQSRNAGGKIARGK